MKAQVSREHLLKGIQTIYPIVPTKSTLPILSNLLLETRKDNLYLASTDLELGISCSVPAEVVEEGSITLPAKRLNDLVKELPNKSLSVTTRKNQQVSIECDRSFFKIMGLPKEEFPRLPPLDNQEGLVIDQGVLEAMLSLTSFAASRDESRYVLTGILFIWKGESLRLVATDGRRLALVERQTMTPTPTERQAIVPLKAVTELHRLLGEAPTVKILWKENQIAFDLGNTQLISRLIDGKFPNFEQVIPPESPQKLKASKEELLLAIRRIGLWTTQDSPSIRLDVKSDKVVLSKQTPEMGEAHEEIQAGFLGNDLSVGFNPTYLIEALKALPDEEIEMELPSPDRPGVIRTKDHYLYVVLPMQLGP